MSLPPKDELFALLSGSGLFRDVGPGLLETAMDRSLQRTVEAGGFFFMQGDKAAHAYVLVQGRVRMLQITPNGQQIVMRIMTPGQTFGGVALIDPPAGYPATAQADEDSAALAWDTATLRELADRDAAIPRNAMQLMHGYILELQDRQGALVGARVEQRIARSLLKLAAQSGKKLEEGVLIDLPLTRQDVAEMSGTTLYTASRVMSAWEREGLLQIGRERVVIRDPHGLVRIADDLVK